MAIDQLVAVATASPLIEFDLVNEKVRITDTGDWLGALSLATPDDSVKILVQITGPSGDVLNDDTAYLADNYGAPDIEALKADPDNKIEVDFDLANDGSKLTGTYTINFKYQVNDLSPADTVTFEFLNYKYVYAGDLCADLPDGSIAVAVDYKTSTLKTTDNTAYGSYESIVREHYIYPPLADKFPDNTNDADVAELTFGPSITTGTYDVSVKATLTYEQEDGSKVICTKTTTREFEVNFDDNMCKMYCIISKYRAQYYAETVEAKADAMFKNLTLATAEYFLAVQGRLCGEDIDHHLDKVYAITGISKDCSDCSDVAPATPIIPSGTAKGDPGADGRGIATMTQTGSDLVVVFTDGTKQTFTIPSGSDGADGQSFITSPAADPGPGDGNDGDTWLNLTSYELFTKAGGTWTSQGVIKGTDGADGADGVGIIETDYTDKTVASFGSYDDVNKFSILVEPADNAMPTDGSRISIEVVFSSEGKQSPSDDIDALQVRIVQAGNGSSPFNLVRKHPGVLQYDAIAHLWATGYYYVKVDLVRKGSNLQRVELIDSNVEYVNYKSDVLDDITVDLASDFLVEARGRNGANAGSIVLRSITIKKYIN